MRSYTISFLDLTPLLLSSPALSFGYNSNNVENNVKHY